MPIPYAGSSRLIPVNPTGYVPVDGVPYPREPAGPTDPNRNRDLLNNVIDPAMEPDLGARTSDVATAEALKRLSASPGKAGKFDYDAMSKQNIGAGGQPVTVLQPSRTQAFSTRDAQALQTLDPRALEEARGLAALDQPKKMTGSFGGQSFEMTPAARVDRNALAGIYNKFQTKQGQERQDSVRAQEQGGKERIVSIPGEQATKRREMELGTEERLAGKKFESEAPVRAADIAAKQAQTAAVTGAEGRAQAQAARQPSPQQEAIDAALAEAQASPFAQTPAGRQRIMALYKMSTAGKAVPADQQTAIAESAAGPAPDIGTVAAEIMADPGMAKLIEQAKASKPGFFSGTESRSTGAAARQLAERAIRARLARSGMTPEDAQQFITSILGPGATPGSQTTNAVESATRLGRSMPFGMIGGFGG